MGTGSGRHRDAQFTTAVVGYAASTSGLGVAYVRCDRLGCSEVLRVLFRVQSSPGLFQRETGYAALAAVSLKLAQKLKEGVIIRLQDDSLIQDIRGHRDVPAPLCLSYVRLGCALNALPNCRLEKAGGEASDLTARARAEVNLTVAA